MERTRRPTRRERGWLLLRLSRLLRYADVDKARTYAGEALALARTRMTAHSRPTRCYQRGLLACFAGDVAGGLPELEAGADALVALSDAERAQFAAHAAAVDAPSSVPDGRGTVTQWRAAVGRLSEARTLGESLIAAGAGGDEATMRSLRDAYRGLASHLCRTGDAGCSGGDAGAYPRRLPAGR